MHRVLYILSKQCPCVLPSLLVRSQGSSLPPVSVLLLRQPPCPLPMLSLLCGVCLGAPCPSHGD
jgi:hypothetical protein